MSKEKPSGKPGMAKRKVLNTKTGYKYEPDKSILTPWLRKKGKISWLCRLASLG